MLLEFQMIIIRKKLRTQIMLSPKHLIKEPKGLFSGGEDSLRISQQICTVAA